MKKIFFTLTLLSNLSYAQTKADFRKIFQEIESTNSVSEAISVREKYLTDMKNLSDFNQLTNFEKLSDGEQFFTHYQNKMSEFIANNVADFINPDIKSESNIFIDRIFPKVKNNSKANQVAELGLAYVNTCEEFQNYISKTMPSLRNKYIKRFCSKNGGTGNYDLRSVLFQPRILQEGRWDAVNFNDYVYVKRIFISAEGIRKDAYFDIMVNGETKGTIYVPGRDPSYIVTVEDYTDSILLRSLSGNAKILSVILEVK